MNTLKGLDDMVTYMASPIPEEEHARRKQIYEETNSDIEAAKMLNMSTQGFRVWRKNAKLPSRGKPGRKTANGDGPEAKTKGRKKSRKASRRGATNGNGDDAIANALTTIREATGESERLRRTLTRARDLINEALGS